MRFHKLKVAGSAFNVVKRATQLGMAEPGAPDKKRKWRRLSKWMCPQMCGFYIGALCSYK